MAYYLEEGEAVWVKIYDELGKMVWDTRQIHGELGYNEIVWDGKDNNGYPVPSGIYLCLIGCGDSSKGALLSKGTLVKVGTVIAPQ